MAKNINENQIKQNAAIEKAVMAKAADSGKVNALDKRLVAVNRFVEKGVRGYFSSAYRTEVTNVIDKGLAAVFKKMPAMRAMAALAVGGAAVFGLASMGVVGTEGLTMESAMQTWAGLTAGYFTFSAMRAGMKPNAQSMEAIKNVPLIHAFTGGDMKRNMKIQQGIQVAKQKGEITAAEAKTHANQMQAKQQTGIGNAFDGRLWGRFIDRPTGETLWHGAAFGIAAVPIILYVGAATAGLAAVGLGSYWLQSRIRNVGLPEMTTEEAEKFFALGGGKAEARSLDLQEKLREIQGLRSAKKEAKNTGDAETHHEPYRHKIAREKVAKKATKKMQKQVNFASQT